MQIETTRFGTIEVPDEEVVRFGDGLPGFPDVQSMVLLGAGDLAGAEMMDHHTLYWLQDTADPGLAFLTTVPWSAYPDYDIEIDGDDVVGTDPADVCVLAIVTVRRGEGRVVLTTNLRAPIVIDTRRRTGQQVILGDSDWPVQAPLVDTAVAG